MTRFTARGWEDYTSWADDRKTLLATNRLLEQARRDPGAGVGKPERLSGDLSGCWSRRIDPEHRLVCTIADGEIVVDVFTAHPNQTMRVLAPRALRIERPKTLPGATSTSDSQ